MEGAHCPSERYTGHQDYHHDCGYKNSEHQPREDLKRVLSMHMHGMSPFHLAFGNTPAVYAIKRHRDGKPGAGTQHGAVHVPKIGSPSTATSRRPRSNAPLSVSVAVTTLAPLADQA